MDSEVVFVITSMKNEVNTFICLHEVIIAQWSLTATITSPLFHVVRLLNVVFAFAMYVDLGLYEMTNQKQMFYL